MRDFLFPSAMMISIQLTSNVRTILMRIYIALCAFFFQTEAFPKAPPAFASRISYGVY
jgi:hypothetical protein